MPSGFFFSFSVPWLVGCAKCPCVLDLTTVGQERSCEFPSANSTCMRVAATVSFRPLLAVGYIRNRVPLLICGAGLSKPVFCPCCPWRLSVVIMANVAHQHNNTHENLCHFLECSCQSSMGHTSLHDPTDEVLHSVWALMINKPEDIRSCLVAMPAIRASETVASSLHRPSVLQTMCFAKTPNPECRC